MDPDIDFGAMLGSFDTVLLGRKAYEATRNHGGVGMPGMKTCLFSRTLRPEERPGVSASDRPAEVPTALRATSGKDTWLFGGGLLFRSLLQLGQVDSVEVAVIPVLLCGWFPRFPGPSMRTELRLTGHRVYGKTGTVWLEHAPTR